MNRKNTMSLALALALTAMLGLAVQAQAQGPGAGKGYGYGPMMGYYGQTVSPEKQEAAQKAYTEFWDSTSQMRQQLAAKQYELNALLYGGSTDDKKVQSLTKEINDLRSKLFEARVGLQKKLAKEGLQDSGMGFMGGYGHMGGYGPGMGYGGGYGPGMMGGYGHMGGFGGGMMGW